MLVIGGGAAGFMAAITAAEVNPELEVIIIEKSHRVLEKVKISGGGRCNVTHNCHDAKQLISYYPRGNRELLGPFMTFSCTNTIEWFRKRGVALKAEPDGRMFPVTDNSETIVHCFLTEAYKRNIQVQTSCQLLDFDQQESGHWMVKTSNKNYRADYLLLATGSTPSIWRLLESKQIRIVEPLPSLFTFNSSDASLKALMGLSVEHAEVSIPSLKLVQNGPLLITHWGFSGPAILKLSAWGARKLNECQYKFQLVINWSSKVPLEAFIQKLKTEKNKTKIGNLRFEPIPSRLWRYLTEHIHIAEKTVFDLSKKDLQAFLQVTHHFETTIVGKSTFKEEFVTAGGIDLKQINFKTFEFKQLQNIFAAGEILDIDAVTGGFNFQAAWTGGYIAGKTIGERSKLK